MKANRGALLVALALAGVLVAGWWLLPGDSDGGVSLGVDASEPEVALGAADPRADAQPSPELAKQREGVAAVADSAHELGDSGLQEPEGEAAEADPTTEEAPDTPVATVRFCAVDASGDAVGEPVTVRLLTPGAKYATDMGVATPDESGCGAVSTKDHAGDGVLVFQAELAGGTAWARSEPLLFVAGNSLDLGQIVLMKPSQRYPIPLLKGTIVDDSGEPVTNARGSFDLDFPQTEGGPEGADRRGELVIDDAGHFLAYGWDEARTGELMLYAEGYEHLGLHDIELPALSLNVEMARQFRVEGSILVPEGWPDLGRFGAWGRSDKIATGIRVGEDGSFSALLSAKSLTFEVTYPIMGFIIHRAAQAEPAGDVIHIGEVDLGEHARLHSFVVLGPDGEPLAETGLKVSTATDAPVFTMLKTDADGRYIVILPRTTERLTLARHDHPSIELELAGLGETVQLP